MRLRQLLLLSCLPLVSVAQENMTLQSWYSYDERAADVWGWESEDGHFYAIIGIFDGTSIVDITDPSSPIEVAFVGGPESIWRDIKTWNDHAYVVNETGGGMLIIDLSDLPGVPDTTSYTGDSLATAHNIFIDEHGIAYVIGSNRHNGGALFLDLNSDPMAPEQIGYYDVNYCHDLYVRGDTMWTAELYVGQFGVVDVSDKASPVVLATQTTPAFFTHNLWLSDDGDYLFTTDEVSGAPVAAYDVSDLSDIRLIDTWESSPGAGVIPHNTFYHDGYLVTSYYRDGVTIVDAHRPDNLIETGYYDTSPFPSGNGYNGCWGVYPYFSNDLIAASDIEEGLFILQPDYQRASYLEGVVSEEGTGMLLPGSLVEILGTEQTSITDFLGGYKTGTSAPGLYDVRVSKSGCLTEIASGVELLQAEVTSLNFNLTCTASVAIEHPEDIKLEVNPSVFQDHCTLTWNEISEALEIQIFDLCGRLVESMSMDTRSGRIDLGADLHPGIYLIDLQADDLRQQVRVIRL